MPGIGADVEKCNSGCGAQLARLSRGEMTFNRMDTGLHEGDGVETRAFESQADVMIARTAANVDIWVRRLWTVRFA
jgi:hypothetical protein